jgi:hypothetical protein
MLNSILLTSGVMWLASTGPSPGGLNLPTAPAQIMQLSEKTDYEQKRYGDPEHSIANRRGELDELHGQLQRSDKTSRKPSKSKMSAIERNYFIRLAILACLFPVAGVIAVKHGETVFSFVAESIIVGACIALGTYFIGRLGGSLTYTPYHSSFIGNLSAFPGRVLGAFIGGGLGGLVVIWIIERMADAKITKTAILFCCGGYLIGVSLLAFAAGPGVEDGTVSWIPLAIVLPLVIGSFMVTAYRIGFAVTTPARQSSSRRSTEL